MRSSRGLRNPHNLFYCFALLGPLVMLSGLMLHGSSASTVDVYDEAGMYALFFRLYLLVYHAVAVIGPMLLVVTGLGLPLIGAIYVRERLLGRVRRTPQGDLDLWPIYATALAETLVMIALFSHLLGAAA